VNLQLFSLKMPSKLLQEVADYCWSKNFLGAVIRSGLLFILCKFFIFSFFFFVLFFIDVFRNFFTEHGEIFEDAPALTGGEHNMKYYSLFQVYLKLYEVLYLLFVLFLNLVYGSLFFLFNYFYKNRAHSFHI
jgi:hypothetical protein